MNQIRIGLVPNSQVLPHLVYVLPTLTILFYSICLVESLPLEHCHIYSPERADENGLVHRDLKHPSNYQNQCIYIKSNHPVQGRCFCLGLHALACPEHRHAHVVGSVVPRPKRFFDCHVVCVQSFQTKRALEGQCVLCGFHVD